MGGGTGTSTLLSGLKKYNVNLSVAVSTWDDGGSSGRLRKEFGVIPPGDIRQCLLALSNAPEDLKQLVGFRFAKGELSGHVVGNIMLSALEFLYGNVEVAIEKFANILQSTGQVFPVTLKPTLLSAKYANGRVVVGEHNIDEPSLNFESKIKSIQLKSNLSVNRKVLEAITKADIIIFGPGDLFTSTLPNLLVKGVKENLKKSKAQKILVTNIMTKHGQTNGFGTKDFVDEFKKYAGFYPNTVIVNTQKPEATDLKRYKTEKAEFVEPEVLLLKQTPVKVVLGDLIAFNKHKKQRGDNLKRSFIRHNSEKLAKIIISTI